MRLNKDLIWYFCRLNVPPKADAECGGFTVERNPLFANSAITLAQQLVASRYACRHIQERSLLFTVRLFLHKNWWPEDTHADTFRREAFCLQCDYSCTRTGGLKIHMRTHSGEKPFVYSATIPAQELVAWRYTCGHFQERSLLFSVRLFLHKSWWPEDTHAHTFRRKIFCLHTV